MLKNRSTHTLLLVGLLLLTLLVAACSPAEETAEPTEAPATEEQVPEETEDAEAEDAEAEDAEEADAAEAEEAEEEAAPIESAAGMTELPDDCMVVILEGDNGRSTVTIGRNSPSASAPTPRSYRVGTSYDVGQIVENEDGLWYELYLNNRTQGFVLAEQVGLGDGCE